MHEPLLHVTSALNAYYCSDQKAAVTSRQSLGVNGEVLAEVSTPCRHRQLRCQQL
jgi:hypothetical protein